MAPRELLSDEQRRLLRITGLMPLVTVSNLAPVLGTGERSIRRMLNGLRRRRLGVVGASGDDGAAAGAVVSDPSGGGPALRQRPPACRATGSRAGCPALRLLCPAAGRLRRAVCTGPRARAPLRTSGFLTLCCASDRTMTAERALTTNIRRGPPPAGASKCPCAAWPCSRLCTA